jgi:hypothetical protein
VIAVVAGQDPKLVSLLEVIETNAASFELKKPGKHYRVSGENQF